MFEFKQFIREIPDWPKKGIGFKDITPLLQNSVAFKVAVDELSKPFEDKGIDMVVGIDARGFILAAAMAYKLGAGLAIVRKKGKLPWRTISREYALEYASNTLEMHEDAIQPGQTILLVDDVLATGGTMAAAVDMVKQLGGSISGLAFLTVLDFLKGKEKLGGLPIHTLIRY